MRLMISALFDEMALRAGHLPIDLGGREYYIAVVRVNKRLRVNTDCIRPKVRIEKKEESMKVSLAGAMAIVLLFNAKYLSLRQDLQDFTG